jgi:hypothetical protein
MIAEDKALELSAVKILEMDRLYIGCKLRHYQAPVGKALQ